MSMTDAAIKYKIVQGIRKVYFQMGVRKQVMDRNIKRVPTYKKDGTRGKVDRILRQCECCREWVMTKECQVDHIDPVVPYQVQQKYLGTPKLTWDDFIHRMIWCGIDNLWRLCTTCHDRKTALEKVLRKNWRDYEAGRCEKPNIIFLGKEFDTFEVINGRVVKKND